MIKRGSVPSDGFTIVSNAWLRDSRLSFKVKGLLAYIASHAAGYRLTLEQIVAETKDGIDAVRATIADAKAAGYLRSVEVRNEHGHRTGTDYELCEPAYLGKSQVGETPPSADQAKDDLSAGQAQMGKSQVGNSDPKKTTPPTEEKKTTGKKTTSPSARGTRLPADWLPDESLKAWARENAPGVGWKHHQVFVDYWIAQPGQKGVKLDWAATWRNWMRKESERLGARPTSGAPRTFRQMDADDRERESLIVRAMDIVLEADPRLSATQAREIVMDLLDQGKLDLNTLSTSAATGYSELDVIKVESREVTGS